MLDRKLVHYIVAVVLLASLIPLQSNIDGRREEEKLVIQDQPAIRPGQTAIGLLLAGFRGLAANMLWFRITVLFQQDRVTEEIPLFQAISYLQPRFRRTWSFGAWHMAYNVSASFFDREELTDEEVDFLRFRCFEIGEQFLREGIKANPYHYDLQWDLAFTILYYKKYKFLKEKGWPGEDEALREALKEMKSAFLFQPPLAQHPAYVGRIIAIVMAEGGLLEDAYKMWHRLKTWPHRHENMNIVNRHMKRVVRRLETQDGERYALELENENKLPEAYKVWYNLLTAARKRKAELAEDTLAEPEEVERTDVEAESFAENAARLEEVLKNKGVDVGSLQEAALEEGRPQGLQERIDSHFQSLKEQAKKDHEADRAETKRTYRKLTKPAPKLDWWMFLFVPLLLAAAGHLLFGKETYAS